jgi:hypothetical protein
MKNAKLENGSNRYELLKQCKETGLFNKLVFCGIISLPIATWFDIYEKYIFYFKNNNKTKSVNYTADYFNVNERTIYRIISFMESK